MSEAQDFEKVTEKSDTKIAAFEQSVSITRRVQHFLHSTPSAVPLIVLIASILIFGLLKGDRQFLLSGDIVGFFASDRFFSYYTLTLILQQIAVGGILAAAETLVILTAGIDLSIGVIMVLSAVVMGNCVLTYGLPAPLAILIGLAVGSLCGLLNGVLVAFFRLPPFIVTLGTWYIVESTNFIYSGNNTLREADLEAQTNWLHVFGISFKIGPAVFTLGVIAMVLLFVLLWYVLSQTAWGRHLYAVGDDPDAAQLSGVPVNKMLVSVYVVAGFIAAFAAWVSIGRNGSISPSNAVTDYNLQAITASVIGGISLFGGRGLIAGTFFGTLIVGVVSMGLNMVGADPQLKVGLTGVLIIFAVAVDQWIRRVSR